MGITPRSGANPLNATFELLEPVANAAVREVHLAGEVGDRHGVFLGVGERLGHAGGRGQGVRGVSLAGVYDLVGLD